jgi:acyl phosphate:glycerol-3-phosphate acyltransferase
MTLALAFPLGYLLGSVPFGLIVTLAAGGPDVRTIGSGNIGATNVLRTGNKKIAAATLLGDILKGTVAVLVTSYVARSVPALGLSPYAPLAAGLGAFLGHLFPVWLKFKGGKGVATYIGVLLGLFWPAMLIFCAIWLAIAFLTRYSSLSALVASALTPAALYLLGQPHIAVLFLVLTVLLWVMHRGNIQRLLAGEEGKIGAKSAPQSP